MDRRIQFPDPDSHADWKEWARALVEVCTRLIAPTPQDQYPVVSLSDAKSQGVAGGTFTAGAWQIRDLNTETDPAKICLLSGNTFQLPQGRYFMRGRMPAYAVAQHQARLWNITLNAAALIGTSEYAGAAGNSASHSWVRGIVEIKAVTTFRLEHRCLATKTGDGLGVPMNVGTEVYSQLEIWGLA